MSIQQLKDALATLERTWQGGESAALTLSGRIHRRLRRFLQLGEQVEYNSAVINGLYAVSEHMESVKHKPISFDALAEQIFILEQTIIKQQRSLEAQAQQISDLQALLNNTRGEVDAG